MKRNILIVFLLGLFCLAGTNFTGDEFTAELPTPPACGSRDCSLAHAGGISIYKDVTLTGNGASTENLFTVTDQVRVMAIYFVVITSTNCTTFSNVKFQTDDGGAQDDITAVNDISGCVAGDLAYRKAASGTALAYVDSATSGIDEAANNKVNFEFQMVQKTGDVASYIRLSYTGDGSTNIAIRAIIRYQPLNNGASVDAV